MLRGVKREAESSSPDSPPRRRLKRSPSQDNASLKPDPNASGSNAGYQPMDVDYTEEEHIDFFVNHLALPPQLPAEPDATPAAEEALLSFISQRAAEFLQSFPNDSSKDFAAWKRASRMLENMAEIHETPSLSNTKLYKHLRKMEVNDVIPLHIKAQNAGVIFRRVDNSTLTIEYFQASFRSTAVASTSGKLVAQFPLHPRLSFPFNNQCIEQLASLLDTLNRTALSDTYPRYARKAGNSREDTRDVRDIRYISVLLRGIAAGLTSNPERMAKLTQYVSKRTDDYVLGTESVPWRRTPIWLIVRVALQTTLAEMGVDEHSPRGYKNFVTYVLAHVLNAARSHDVARDLLHVLRVKVANRVHKVPPAKQAPTFPYDIFTKAVEETQRFLESRWQEAQSESAAKIEWSMPDSAAIEQSLDFALKNSGEAIKIVQARRTSLQRATGTFDAETFEASHVQLEPSRQYGQSPPQHLNLAAPDCDLWLAIVDVEQWLTGDGVRNWMSDAPSEDRLPILVHFIEQFQSLAARYATRDSNPERFSRLVLAILECWVAMDKTVCSMIPLLLEYSSELAVSAFIPLLLPEKAQMERLKSIEVHILVRNMQAVYHTQTHFNVTNHENSFPSRYFQRSQKLQNLAAKIETEATQEQREKKAELTTKRREHQLLLAQLLRMRHRCDDENFSGDCSKCQTDIRAKHLSILPFEWPLPEDDVEKSVVVFELDVPAAYSLWRDITYDIARLWSAGDPPQKKGPVTAPFMLSGYPGLSGHYKTPATQSITIGSRQNRSNGSKAISFPVSEDTLVLQSHPLAYSMKHSVNDEWLTGKLPSMDIRAHCTPTLPHASPYENLHFALASTTHTPNQVIAKQSQCHPKLSIHDFLAFGHLRSGHRLQFRNVLLNLISSSGLRDPAFYLLIRQAVWQVELSATDDDVYRESHGDLSAPSFAGEVIETLHLKLRQIEQNWQEAWLAGILAFLACRVISLTPGNDAAGHEADEDVKPGLEEDVKPTIAPPTTVQADALRFLRDLRVVLMTFLDGILAQIRSASQIRSQKASATVKGDLAQRAVQVACICRATFTVSSQHLLAEVLAEPDALHQLLLSAFVIQTYCRGIAEGYMTPLRYLVAQDTVFSAESMPVVLQAILSHPEEANRAVSSVWEGFIPAETAGSRGWRRVPGSSRWIACQTGGGNGAEVKRVHLNVLDGRLLVDGRSFDNLPGEVIQHSLFQAIFPGQKFMEVVPSTMAGMDYQLARNINGVQVHFLHHDSELIIRTADADGRTCEVVPSTKLSGDVPNALLQSTFLLYHDQKRVLDFSPAPGASELWDPTVEPIFQLSLAEQSRHLKRIVSRQGVEMEWILSPESAVVRRLSRVFAGLEHSATDLLVAWAPTRPSTSSFYNQRSLIVRLPRYRLNFMINLEGHLESRELPGATVSLTKAARAVGTLVGLHNTLVLSRGSSNSLIIPVITEGKHAFELKSFYDHAHHSTQVTITIPPAEVQSHVKSFIYDASTLLNRLTARDETLTSWFWLALLHVTTSSCLPDPLTDLTGIQQALSMLRSATSFSFAGLDEEHRTLLETLAQTSPKRFYFPIHMMSSENVTWNPALPMLSQDNRIIEATDKVVAHAGRLLLFTPASSKEIKKKAKQPHRGFEALRLRAAKQSSKYVPDFTDIDPKLLDVPYAMGPETVNSNVAAITKATNEFQSPVATHEDLWQLFKDWNTQLQSLSTTPSQEYQTDPFLFLLISHPAKVWFTLFREVQTTLTEPDVRYRLAFSLAIVAYRQLLGPSMAGSLLSIAVHWCNDIETVCKSLPQGQLPVHLGHTRNDLRRSLPTIIEPNIISVRGSTQIQAIERIEDESNHLYAARKKQRHDRDSHRQSTELVDFIAPQWPGNLSWTRVPRGYLIKLDECKPLIQTRFSAIRVNAELHQHAVNLVDAIRAHTDNPISLADVEPIFRTSPTHVPAKARFRQLSLLSLMRDRPPPGQFIVERDEPEPMQAEHEERTDVTELRDLLERLRESNPSNSGISALYADELGGGIRALESRIERLPPPRDVDEAPPASADDFKASLGPAADSISELLVGAAGVWPSRSNRELLRQLTWRTRTNLGDAWKATMLSFAQLLVSYQRADRLARLSRPGLEVEFQKELENIGGIGWNAAQYPDWLLIQLDADMLIRPIQAVVAQQMMTPDENENSVYQLNMGEGKTSVIIPIIAAALADGQQLVRPVVLKPLASQTFELLRGRLSGLADRQITFLPFSREVPVNIANAGRFLDLFRDCQQCHGLVVTLPEHILSMQLQAVYAACSKADTTPALVEMQRWLDKHARDVLDESDALLPPRTQHIWTKGLPRSLSALHTRSIILPEVARLMQQHVVAAAAEHPDDFEVGEKGQDDRFPRLRLLSKTKASELLHQIAEGIVFSDQLDSTSFRTYPKQDQNRAFTFITKEAIPEGHYLALQSVAGGSFEHLLLLRGLFAHGILLHVFMEKRWRVDYGLFRSRTRLAVPYRAKDQPALRAEFGHPDVMLLKTLLSYYYEGLNDAELDICFELLFKSDNPALRYEHWVKGILEHLPASLHTLRGLNLDDKDQKTRHIFPRLRFNKHVIDFYASESVFSRDAKEFPFKLTTNAWDLARRKGRVVTGFSGTRDNSWTLPLSIKQADSAGRRHTTALVLHHILDPRNRKVICTEQEDATALLRRVVALEPRSSVLLDVGAQVLELQNKEVAQVWLQLDTRPDIEAALYFDTEKDEPYVLHREGDTEPLASSLYRTQLEKTLVYLDEAHTRGTDFKFPSGSIAVVTIGPKLTKDKLVQGCMRMRRLADRHSVLFFCNPEVSNKIYTTSGKDRSEELNSSDVLVWTMRETCAQIQDDMQLWKSQGLNFDRRDSIWEPYKRGEVLEQAQLLQSLQEKEGLSLSELYGVQSGAAAGHNATDRQRKIETQCAQFGVTSEALGTSATEEQERELAHEQEEERQVERAPPAEPHAHAVDEYLKRFIRDGFAHSKLLTLADSLKQTTVLPLLPRKSLFRSRSILVSQDFYRTVMFLSEQRIEAGMDDFLRNVQWVLSSAKETPGKTTPVVLISPFEANELLPKIRDSALAFLHMYTPRVTRNQPTVDDLTFFCYPTNRQRPSPVSRAIRRELNLFSGQLFFKNQPTFDLISETLGLFTENEVPEDLKKHLDVHGFVRDEVARLTMGIDDSCAFDASPVKFMRKLIAMRRKGQGFALTHLGKLLYNHKVDEHDFTPPARGSPPRDGGRRVSGGSSQAEPIVIDID